MGIIGYTQGVKLVRTPPRKTAMYAIAGAEFK
jgi:hypothetical protein